MCDASERMEREASERLLLPLCPKVSRRLEKHAPVAGTQAFCRASGVPWECCIYCCETPASPGEFIAVSPHHVLDG